MTARYRSPTTGPPQGIPQNEDEFMEQIKRYDFLRLVFTDLNGVARAIMTAKDNIESFLKDGKHVVICIMAFAVTGEPSAIEDHAKHNFGNIVLRPVIDSLSPWPQTGQDTGARIGQVRSVERSHREARILF